MSKIFTGIKKQITTVIVSLFLWISVVVGFFAGITDMVQYHRYSSKFPNINFTINLFAGIGCFLIMLFSIKAFINLRKKTLKPLKTTIGISSVLIFLIAFMPRPEIGSAIRPDLFSYIGGLGLLSYFLISSNIPPNTPPHTP